MVCKKCGKENVEDAVFCTSCGTRIEVENICPSCGKTVQENSVYCNYCGAKMSGDNDTSLNDESLEDKNLCPACGKEVQENAVYCNFCGARLDGKNVCSSCGELFEGNFCPKCGTSALKKNQNNVSESEKVSKKFNKEKFNNIFNKTGTSILLFGVVFALIFVFLIGFTFSIDSNVQSTSSIVDSIVDEYGISLKVGMYDYFGNIYKDINDVVENAGLKNLEVDYTSPVLYFNAVLGTVATVSVLVAVIVLSILAIINLIKKLCGKDAKNAERLACATMFTYFLGVLLLYAINYSSFNVSVDRNYVNGLLTFNSATLAGIILCSISLGLALICYIIKNREAYRNFKNLITSGIGLISSNFAVIVLAFATSGVFSFTTNLYGTKLNLNSIPEVFALQWAGYLQSNIITDTNTYVHLYIISAVQLAFVTLAVVSIIIQISSLLKNEQKNAWAVNIAMMVVSFTYLAFAVTIRNATYKEFDFVDGGDKLTVVPAIITFVFSFLTLASSVAGKVVSTILPKVDAKKEDTTVA